MYDLVLDLSLDIRIFNFIRTLILLEQNFILKYIKLVKFCMVISIQKARSLYEKNIFLICQFLLPSFWLSRNK